VWCHCRRVGNGEFKETQAEKHEAGQKAEVKVDTYGKTFSGRVDSIAGAPDRC